MVIEEQNHDSARALHSLPPSLRARIVEAERRRHRWRALCDLTIVALIIVGTVCWMAWVILRW